MRCRQQPLRLSRSMLSCSLFLLVAIRRCRRRLCLSLVVRRGSAASTLRALRHDPSDVNPFAYKSASAATRQALGLMSSRQQYSAAVGFADAGMRALAFAAIGALHAPNKLTGSNVLSAGRFGCRRLAVACHKRTDLVDVSTGHTMFQRSSDFLITVFAFHIVVAGLVLASL